MTFATLVKSPVQTMFESIPGGGLDYVNATDVYADPSPLVKTMADTVDDGVPASLQNDVSASSINSKTSPKMWKNLKSWIGLNPVYALLVIITLGFVLGAYIPKLFKRKGAKKW